MTNLNLTDLPDPKKDKVQLKPKETIINLPDIEDIPGEEADDND